MTRDHPQGSAGERLLRLLCAALAFFLWGLLRIIWLPSPGSAGSPPPIGNRPITHLSGNFPFP